MLTYFKNGTATNLSGVEMKKHRSMQKILRHFFLHGDSTCNDIARHIKLSIPSVQTNINELTSEELIEVKGQRHSSGGRPPSIYGLKKDSFYMLCINICRHDIRMAFINSHLELHSDIITHDIEFTDDSTYLEIICKYIENQIDTSKIETERIIGIGLSMPGAINAREGINYSYKFEEDEALADVLERRFKLPVFLENDANVLAQTELWQGHARGKKNALVILLSWGIGLGLIINGEIYQGSSGFAGEFSHIPAKVNGDLCWCNKQGCLETLASATALSKNAKKAISDGYATSLLESIKKDKVIQPELIIKAANIGDQLAVKLLSEVAYELGKGIAMLIQILNPEIVVLGGKMSKANQYIITPIQQALNTHCNPLLINNLEVTTTDFSEEAGLLGCAINVVDGLLARNP